MQLTDKLVRGFVGWQLQFFFPESGHRFQGEILAVELIPGNHGSWPVLKGKLAWTMVSKDGDPWFDQANLSIRSEEELPLGEFETVLYKQDDGGVGVYLTPNSCLIILPGHELILFFVAPGHVMWLKPAGYIFRRELGEYGKGEPPLTATERGL